MRSSQELICQDLILTWQLKHWPLYWIYSNRLKSAPSSQLSRTESKKWVIHRPFFTASNKQQLPLTKVDIQQWPSCDCSKMGEQSVWARDCPVCAGLLWAVRRSKLRPRWCHWFAVLLDATWLLAVPAFLAMRNLCKKLWSLYWL